MIGYILVNNLDYEKNFWFKILHNELSEKRIIFYGNPGRIGEHIVYLRNIKAATRLNMDYIGFRINEKHIKNPIKKHFYYMAGTIINIFFRPQLKIAVTHLVNLLPGGPGLNVVYINIPSDKLFSNKHTFLPKFDHLKKYDIYADLYSFVHGHNPALVKVLDLEKLEFKKIIPMYNVALPYAEFIPTTYNKAVITGSLWGCNRDSLRVSRALKKLGENDMLVSYGLRSEYSFLGEAYKGFIEFAQSYDSILNIQREYGIGLVIYNLGHMEEGLPTNRIAETVVSGAVVISDEHYFVRKYFGNNVLYFNSLTSSEEIYRQIQTHIEHIRANPMLYLAKTKAAHQIFREHLTLEAQLEQLYKQAVTDNCK